MPRADRAMELRRARQRRYLVRRRIGARLSADPTNVVDFLHLAGVHVPNAHPSTLRRCRKRFSSSHDLTTIIRFNTRNDVG